MKYLYEINYNFNQHNQINENTTLSFALYCINDFSMQEILDPTDYPIGGVSGQNMNHRFAHLYWNSSQYPDFNGCIPPADLNFYLEKTRELINRSQSDGGIRPAGKGLISIEMWGTEEDYEDHTIYEYNARVKYGVLRLSPDPRAILE